MAMFIDIAVGETLTVGEFKVRLQFKTGRKARLKIEAPTDIHVSLDKGQSMEFYQETIETST